MATLCLFCNKKKARKKYCSVKCIKRAWYLLNNPNIKSYFVQNPDFWKTETGIGFKWEKWAAKFLGAEHLKFSRGADLNLSGKLIDVKVSNLYKRKIKRGKKVGNAMGWWVFNRNKQKPVDFFFCIALKNNKPFKKFFIPENIFPKSGIVAGWKSKYDKYLI